ncbi:hypothetical protein FXO38_19702 [Capsicum annuum]|nr:hypothetical protein FXO38_19702 [Capsicum annuum]
MLEEMNISSCPMFVFPTLSSVKKLEIRGKVDAESLSSISNLSTLTSLEFLGNHEATSFPDEMFNGLAYLKYLQIYDLKKLNELPTSLASLNALKSLVIRNCSALESLPKALQKLTALTTLTVIGSPKVKDRCVKGIGEDWRKIAHIPNLLIMES